MSLCLGGLVRRKPGTCKPSLNHSHYDSHLLSWGVTCTLGWRVPLVCMLWALNVSTKQETAYLGGVLPHRRLSGISLSPRSVRRFKQPWLFAHPLKQRRQKTKGSCKSPLRPPWRGTSGCDLMAGRKPPSSLVYLGQEGTFSTEFTACSLGLAETTFFRLL